MQGPDGILEDYLVTWATSIIGYLDLYLQILNCGVRKLQSRIRAFRCNVSGTYYSTCS